ncbi:type 4b pilus protein PilO2 [Chromobacterium amazonense]|uniref:type 4b pilus protein PilO2 n=1 Tax=Chromobacterium amazonense TaxID=1382803 RepID=UPI003F7A73F0
MASKLKNEQDDTPSDTIGIVRLGRRAYAVNLIWMLQEVDGSSLKEQAKASAERFNVDLIALRPGGGMFPDQFALGDFALKHVSGISSLASAVAEPLSGSLLAVWLLDGGIWWLVGINQEGVILYDRAFIDENEVRESFELSMAGYAWDQLVCPEYWQVPGSQAVELTPSLLGTVKTRLHAVSMELKSVLLLGGGVLLLMVLFALAYFLWPDEKAPGKTIALPAVHPSSIAQKYILPQSARPWQGKPQVLQELQRCVDGLQTFSMEAASVPGWAVVKAHCDDQHITFQLDRAGGYAHWLPPLVTKLKGPPMLQMSDSEHANLTWKLGALPMQNGKTANAGLDDIQQALQAQFDDLGMTVKWEKVDGDWPAWQLQLSLEQSPMLLSPFFSRLTATVIKAISYDFDKQSWSVTVDIFGYRNV